MPIGLADRFGRLATDLRVSLTDRCNLRCTYCMPSEGLPWAPAGDLLSDLELLRLIRVHVGLGVRTVRLTGGEPLLRPRLPELVQQINAISGGPECTLTTNGIGLAALAPRLADAGLTRVNVSLDTLRSDRFERLTRRARLSDVLAGLRAAQSAGLLPVKLNAVLVRGINDDEACDLLNFCIGEGYELRFIEQMPLSHTGSGIAR